MGAQKNIILVNAKTPYKMKYIMIQVDNKFVIEFDFSNCL